MTTDRILSVKFSPGGTNGMTITYERSEAKGNIHYQNPVTKTVKWPIQGDLLKHLQNMKHWLPKMTMPEDAEIGVISTGWKLNGTKIILTGLMQVDYGDGYETVGFAAPAIGENSVYYLDLIAYIIKTEELIREYMTTKAQLNLRQMVMDFAENGEIKGLSDDKDISKMDDKELLTLAEETIEKRGGTIMWVEEDAEEPKAEEPIEATA